MEQSDTKKKVKVELEVDYLGRKRIMFSEHGTQYGSFFQK